jgi:hypothetical protein
MKVNIILISLVLILCTNLYSQKSDNIFNGYLSPLAQTAGSAPDFSFQAIYRNDNLASEGFDTTGFYSNTFIAVANDGNCYELPITSLNTSNSTLTNGELITGSVRDLSGELISIPSGIAAIYGKTDSSSLVAYISGLPDELKSCMMTLNFLMLDSLQVQSSQNVIGQNVTITPTGNLSSVNVQSGLEELQSDIDNLSGSISGTISENYIPVADANGDLEDSNVFTNGDQLGINTDSPTAALTVIGQPVATDRDLFTFKTSTGATILDLENGNSDNTPVPILYGPNSRISFYNGIQLRQLGGSAEMLTVNNSANQTKFAILNNGNAEVHESLLLSGSDSYIGLTPHDTPPVGSEGNFYMDDSENTFKGHNGTEFFRFMQQSSTVPTEGQVGVYNATTGLYEPTDLTEGVTGTLTENQVPVADVNGNLEDSGIKDDGSKVIIENNRAFELNRGLTWGNVIYDGPSVFTNSANGAIVLKTDFDTTNINQSVYIRVEIDMYKYESFYQGNKPTTYVFGFLYSNKTVYSVNVYSLGQYRGTDLFRVLRDTTQDNAWCFVIGDENDTGVSTHAWVTKVQSSAPLQYDVSSWQMSYETDLSNYIMDGPSTSFRVESTNISTSAPVVLSNRETNDAYNSVLSLVNPFGSLTERVGMQFVTGSGVTREPTTQKGFGIEAWRRKGLLFNTVGNSADPNFVGSFGFIMDDDGQFGIGTELPQAKLHVSAGDMLIDNNRALKSYTTGNSPINLMGINSSNQIIYGSNTDVSSLVYLTSGGYRLDYKNGKLGFGTASPQYSIDINATDGIRLARGTTAQRPVGAAGVMRYNTTESLFETHNGTSYSFLPTMSDALTTLNAENYTFNIDQPTTGKDGQVLTFNETSGEIELQQGAPAMVTGWTTNSTNASAEITVGHGLGTTPQAVTIQGVSDGDYNYAVTSADGITFTVKVRNGGSLHTSSAISFYWVAFGSTEE